MTRLLGDGPGKETKKSLRRDPLNEAVFDSSVASIFILEKAKNLGK